jgi:hypothetical protein
MKFTLIYDGDLPSSGNKSKPLEASKIRNEFHDQLADLWDRHIVLRQLRHEARVSNQPGVFRRPASKAILPAYDGPPPPLGQSTMLVDLCAPISIPDVGGFVPLVRHSLYLACAVDVLFLRHEEPFSLMKNGGDLDGRLATLFDALRMPDPKHSYVGHTPTADPLYVVLEDDALISDFSVRGGRLLGNRVKKPHAVRLTIDVTIKALRVSDVNQCLTGA